MASFLQPIPNRDRVLPGLCVLVRWRSKTQNIRDYKLGIICPESMLPEQVARSKPRTAITRSRPRPVWLIGQSTFLWVPRHKLYSLDESQRIEYAQRTKHDEKELGNDFATYFTLAEENDGNFEYWKNSIVKDKERIDRGDNAALTTGKKKKRTRQGEYEESCVSEDASDTAEASDDSHLEDSSDDGLARKKMRATVTRSDQTKAGSRSLTASLLLPYAIGLSGTPTASIAAPSATLAASSQDTLIKNEQDEQNDYGGVLDGELIEVFVGPTNTRFRCSRKNVTQSPILTDRIITRAGAGQHAFIMDPTFSDTDPSEFEAVVQFLHAHEYEPLLHHLSDGKFSLEDSLTPIDYAHDLRRSANLFNLAKRFQLPALGSLVLRKILHGHHKYDIPVFLSFALTVLGYRETEFRDGDEIKGMLEEWVIRFLAENMATICSRVRGDAERFWKLMEVKGVELRVMETRVELCKRYPGARVEIED